MNSNPISRGGHISAGLRAVQAVQRTIRQGQGPGVGTLYSTRGTFPQPVKKRAVSQSSAGNFVATWQ